MLILIAFYILLTFNIFLAGVATILNKIKRDETTVGVDGSVFRYHPYFHKLMDTKIAELTDPAYKFNLMLSEDGSGRGAALVAAVAVRYLSYSILHNCLCLANDI